VPDRQRREILSYFETRFGIPYPVFESFALLDRGKIIRSKMIIAMEVVIEPALRRRAESDLSSGVELLDGLREDMRAIMTQKLQGIGMLWRHDFDPGVFRDDRRQVLDHAIDLDRECRLGKARPNRRRDIGAGYGPFELSLAAIGQRDRRHDAPLEFSLS